MSFSGPSMSSPKNPYMGRVASYAADQGGTADSALSGAPVPTGGSRVAGALGTALVPITSSAKTVAPSNKATNLGGSR